ncbi:MAG TPA: alkaline phosphatase family protein, partial [bacterium]|nr:alkaline phosphatase family protein [bacterium]
MMRAAGAGAATGILFATLLGIWTARINSLASFADALAVTGWLVLAFGGMFACAAAAGSCVRVRSRIPSVDRGLGAALALFLFVLALRAFEMELAYPKSLPFVRGFASMLAFALAFACGAAALSMAVGVASGRVFHAARQRGTLLRFSSFVIAEAFLLGVLFISLPRSSTPIANASALNPILTASTAARARVLLLGCDGADPQVVDRLLSAGLLPNLQALQERGVRARLRTIRGRSSPAIWTSIATGVSPAAHGIEDFYVQRLAGSTAAVARFPIAYLGLNHGLLLHDLFGDKIVRVTPVTSTLVRRRPIWDIVAEQDVSCTVVNWLVTWPAPSEGPPIITERAYTMASEHGLAVALADSTLVHPPQLAVLFADALADSAALSCEDEFMGRIAQCILERGQPAFFAATFRDVDAEQHLHWNAYEPQYFRARPESSIAADAARIPAAYMRFDRIAGELIAAAGPDAIVIVVSDHGHGPWFTWFGRGTPGGHTNSPDGIFFAAGPGIRAAART